MNFLLKLLRWALFALFGALVVGLVSLSGVYLYFVPDLPSVESLKKIHLQVPLRIYTRQGELIAEFGEKRRNPKRFADIPDLAIKAVLAAEDDRFFSHPGVDWHGLVRAAWTVLITGEKRQGGSTITMQVARNFFLSPKKTYERKIREILLAIRIEHNLTKEEILELYLNKIYFGNRAYGLGAAAEVYYGRDLSDLDLAQIAMLAGLPKAPSRFNPVADPDRAVLRRNNYVLKRMHDLGYITAPQYQEALAKPITAKVHAPDIVVQANYVAEMARAYLIQQYGEDAYTAGLKVYTTIKADHQRAAQSALRDALNTYDRRHGYRGPEGHLDVPENNEQDWDTVLSETPKVGWLSAAIVSAASDTDITVYIGRGEEIIIPFDNMKWARSYIDENHRGPIVQKPADILTVGDIIRVAQDDKGNWHLFQSPAVEGAFVAMNPSDGAILALVGGYDFFRSKFNRAAQAKRQPGSSFKPILYTAALEAGFTPASLINDAPIVFSDPSLEADWRPENYSGKFYGPTRMREALVMSRNLVSIRLLRAVGVNRMITVAERFGFRRDQLPNNLSLALGSGSATPIDMVTAFATFANGGFKIEPYLIDRVEGFDGRILEAAQPVIACPQCPVTPPEAKTDSGIDIDAIPATEPVNPENESIDEYDTDQVRYAERVLSPQVHYLITSMMRDVARRGTARRTRSLKRDDLAGKTGTTNDQVDAWFSGFNRQLVATAWVGFDRLTSLGNRETGGRAALPVWMSFMKEALKDSPEQWFPQPPGLVTVRIDPETGATARPGQPNAIEELFLAGHTPDAPVDTKLQGPTTSTATDIREGLF